MGRVQPRGFKLVISRLQPLFPRDRRKERKANSRDATKIGVGEEKENPSLRTRSSSTTQEELHRIEDITQDASLQQASRPSSGHQLRVSHPDTTPEEYVRRH